MYGWVGKVLRVDLTEGAISETPSRQYLPRFLGGRGLGARIYWEEVPPEVGAFDPENRLIFSTGPLQGTMAPTSGRFMVLGKAPQTCPVESYCRSGVGGHWAPELKWAGYDALIIQGKARRPVYLFIHNGGAEVLDATQLWGLDTYQAQRVIWSTHGSGTRVMVIGRAGENRSRIACILTDSGDASGQCGFGGVMGSKNLKAIAVHGTGYVRVARPKELMRVTNYCQNLFSRKAAHGDPLKPEETGFKFNIWGGDERGGLTGAPGELWDLCKDPASGYTRVPDGCFACPIACRSRISGPDIPSGVALCVQSTMYLESMAHEPEKGYSKVTWYAAKLGDLYGINAYEITGILPWLSDCFREGILTEERTGLPLKEIGSKRFITELLRMIAYREGFGDLLAEGCQRAAMALGGRAEELMYRYYPRAGKFGGYREHWVYLGGFPTGYALPFLGLLWVLDNRDANVSHEVMSMLWGAARTIGQDPLSAVPKDLIPILRPVMKHTYGSEKAAEFFTHDRKALNWAWAPRIVKRYHERGILKDSYIVCDIAFPYVFNANSKDHIGDTSIESRLYSAVTGEEMDENESYQKGDMLVTLERAIACRDGRTRTDDRFRDLYYQATDAAGRRYKKEELEKAKGDYYRLRGWDTATGIPTRKRLEELGLKDVADELERRGILPPLLIPHPLNPTFSPEGRRKKDEGRGEG